MCAVHPGSMVRTNLVRNSPALRLLFSLARPWTKSADQAAATPVFCICAPDAMLTSGGYYKDCELIPPSALAQDDDLAARLWARSEALVGERLIPSRRVAEPFDFVLTDPR